MDNYYFILLLLLLLLYYCYYYYYIIVVIITIITIIIIIIIIIIINLFIIIIIYLQVQEDQDDLVHLVTLATQTLPSVLPQPDLEFLQFPSPLKHKTNFILVICEDCRILFTHLIVSCVCFYLVQSQYRCVVCTCHVCVFNLVQSQYRCVVHTCHVCVFTWYNHSTGVLYIPVMFVFLPGTITVQVCCSYMSCLCFYLVQSQYRCVVHTCHVCVFTWYNHSTGVVCTCHVCVFTWYNHSTGVVCTCHV